MGFLLTLHNTHKHEHRERHAHPCMQLLCCSAVSVENEACFCVYNENHELGVAWSWRKQILFIPAPLRLLCYECLHF